MKPFESNVTSMPFSNFRLAKVVAGPETFPTTGHTFYIEFLDGEYTRVLGNTAPFYQSRSPRLPICYNLNETIPPEDSIIKVFEQSRQWWTWWGVGSEAPPQPPLASALFFGAWKDDDGYLRSTSDGTVASTPASGGFAPDYGRYAVAYDDYVDWWIYEFGGSGAGIDSGRGRIGTSLKLPADLFSDSVSNQTTPLTDFRISFQGSNITAYEPRFVTVGFGGYYEYDPVLPVGAETAMEFDTYIFAGTLFDLQDDGTGAAGPQGNNLVSGPNVFGPVAWTAGDDWESTYDIATNEPNVMGPQIAGIVNQALNSDYWTDPANGPPFPGAADPRVLTLCFVPRAPAQTGADDLGYFWNLPGVAPNQLTSNGEYTGSPVGKSFGVIDLQSEHASTTIRYFMDS